MHYLYFHWSKIGEKCGNIKSGKKNLSWARKKVLQMLGYTNRCYTSCNPFYLTPLMPGLKTRDWHHLLEGKCEPNMRMLCLMGPSSNGAFYTAFWITEVLLTNLAFSIEAHQWPHQHKKPTVRNLIICGNFFKFHIFCRMKLFLSSSGFVDPQSFLLRFDGNSMQSVH